MEIVLTAHTRAPGGVVGARGGAIVTVTTASVSGKQTDHRRFDGDPVGGVSERLERELVDDTAGVADAKVGRGRRSGSDDQFVRGKAMLKLS